jgi:hypothetical protein
VEETHCFALNGDIFNPEVHGIANCVEQYRNTLPNVYLSNPVNFEDIIRYINEFASHDKILELKSMNPNTTFYIREYEQWNQKYNIMLLLTQGDINDSFKCQELIRESAELPVSYIVVMVGPANSCTNVHNLDRS